MRLIQEELKKSESVNQGRTNTTMAKRKRTKGTNNVDHCGVCSSIYGL
jgi:hypothetical protein